jgi:hypothetical protein
MSIFMVTFTLYHKGNIFFFYFVDGNQYLHLHVSKYINM